VKITTLTDDWEVLHYEAERLCFIETKCPIGEISSIYLKAQRVHRLLFGDKELSRVLLLLKEKIEKKGSAELKLHAMLQE
jgi:hypothetical protein